MDIFLRLGSAVLVGALVGLDRELRNKPAGLRTMALVALGSAMFTMVSGDPTSEVQRDATARVIQGLITGVGFLGAGTILRRQEEPSVHGLTTAATIWLTAALGVGCGLVHWRLVLTGLGLGVLILILEPLEERLHRRSKD